MEKRCTKCGEILGEEYTIWGELGQNKSYLCLKCDAELTGEVENGEIENK